VFAGAAVAVGILIGAFFASPGFRERIVSVVTGEPLRPRIAVLPFTSVNGTDEERGLAGGVTLGVNYGLYAITAKELFVVTSFSPAQKLSPRELIARARDLNVRYLIKGSVAVEAGAVRVDIEQLDAQSSAGGHVWREEFNKPTGQAFKLQDDITLRILEGLDIDLSPAERGRIRLLNDTDYLDAWLAATNGVRHLIQINRPDAVIARKHYQKALSIDEDYSSARRGLAWVAVLSVRLGWADDENSAIQEAQRHLDIVLQKDPNDGTAKSLQGAILLLQGKHDEAIEAGEAARQRLPGSADISAVLAHSLTYVGEHKKALKLIDNAMELSPMHPGFYRWTKGRALRMAKRFEASIEELEKDLGRGEPVIVHLVELAATYSAAGRMIDARRTAAIIKELDGDFSAEAWLQHPRIKIPKIQQKELKYLTDAGL
jgi:TolB-like protein/Tfp pilus assembly protein PilF